MNALNLAWYHYLAVVLMICCAAVLAAVICLGAWHCWTWLTTRGRSERRFEHVVMHATRDLR